MLDPNNQAIVYIGGEVIDRSTNHCQGGFTQISPGGANDLPGPIPPEEREAFDGLPYFPVNEELVLEGLTLDRNVRALRDQFTTIEFSRILYNGHFFTPEREFITSSIPTSQRTVNGLVRLKLYKGNVVVEGRDITTVVFPDAPVRILLTAAPEVRAARRSAELTDQDAAKVAAALHQRDAADSTVVDFLTAAPGVQVVDSTHLDFEQTVDAVLSVVDSTMGARDGR